MLRRPPTQPQTFSNRVRVSREGLLQGDCGPEQWLSLILLFPFQPAMSFSSIQWRWNRSQARRRAHGIAVGWWREKDEGSSDVDNIWSLLRRHYQ